MARRTPTLTKQVRAFYEERLFADGHWPWSHDERLEYTGLTPEQIRDAVWAPAADEWRRGVQLRYNDEVRDARS
jgi:hypothetical protein